MAKISRTLNFSSSEESSEDSDGPATVPQKRNRKTLNWSFMNTVASKQLAENILKEDQKWVVNKTYKSDQGVIIQYLCRQSDICSSRRKIVLHDKSLEASIYGTGDNHDHGEKSHRGKT
jgi:hypothetical protein